MPRNTTFSSPGRRVPFAGEDGINLDHDTVHGALPFFNPTHARLRVDKSAKTQPKPTGEEVPEEAQTAAPGTAMYWRSRDNRKGRHALLVDSSDPYRVATPTATFSAILHGLARMCTEFPYWDISYLVAVFFSIGCLVFVVCGLFSWLPLVAPGSEFPGESIAGGVTAFVGATLFQVGAVLLVFEACNENQTGCFGWALHRLVSNNGESFNGDSESARLLATPAPDNCRHHHQRGRKKEPLSQPSQPERKWEWWPSWDELKTHYIHEIGFVASISMAIGATVFYVCGICSIPGIYDHMSVGAARGVYWLTYLLGGVIFIISSALYMLETQTNWYTPAPRILGWHIGLWNMIGSVGWTLAASLGYCTSSGCAYQSELTLTWASASFFIGSMLLWYEALDKYPVEKDKGKP